METKEMYQQIFQAFSALSDAQELMAMSSTPPNQALAVRISRANDQINHAKRHLLEVIKADEAGYAEAMLALPLTCTLPEEGGGYGNSEAAGR